MAALSGEVSLDLFRKMRASASKIIAKEEVLREAAEKTAKNAEELKQVDEFIKELYKLNDHGNAYNSSKYATKVSKLADKAPGKIKDFEIIHSKSKLENALIYNPKSKLADVWTSNLPDKIKFPERLLIKMRKAVVTHNHPGGSGLSISDIKTFLQGNLDEIRAVTPDGSVFSIKNKTLTGREMQNILGDIEDIIVDYAKKGGSRQDEFDEIYSLIKDKVEYVHYTN